jgi:GNAT superfamily N-acetyltransferase
VHQLRDHLDKETFTLRYREMFEDSNYRIVAVFVDGECRATAGFRFILNFAVGNALYIDDLVTKEEFRSKGYGGILVKYLEGIADSIGFDAVRLDSAIHREEAHRFYEREGFYYYSKHFVKEIPR